jgi:hypothetical protein
MAKDQAQEALINGPRRVIFAQSVDFSGALENFTYISDAVGRACDAFWLRCAD